MPNPGIWPVAIQGLEDAPVISSVNEVDTQKGGLQLYPNPVINELHITSDESIESIAVINVLGARIRNYNKLQTNDMTIPLGRLDPGIYLIEVRTADEQIQISLIVKR